jgi:hypothetical protein
MNLGKFAPYQLFCNVLITCLKPFSIVIETLLHQDVGERYAGVSALIALLLLGVDAEVCPASDSTLLWMLIIGFAVRVVMVRMAGIRRRRRGDMSIHSRSSGKSLLQRVSNRVPALVVLWIEAILVMAAALVASLFNPTVSAFLLWSGGAMLGINLIRLSAAYSKTLDEADVLVEQQATRIEGRLVPVLNCAARGFEPTPIIDVYAVPTESRLIEANSDAEAEPEISGLLPMGGGETWKQ